MKGLRRTGQKMAGLFYSDQTKTLSAFNREPTDFVCLIPRSINSSPPLNKLFLPTRNGYVQSCAQTSIPYIHDNKSYENEYIFEIYNDFL